MNAFQSQRDHLAQQAMQPGWWAYAGEACSALETEPDTAATFTGLRAAVGAVVKAQGYRPAAHELGEWWVIPSRLPALAQGRRSVKGRHDA